MGFHFPVSCTEREHACSLYRRSNSSPLVESLSPTLSVRLLILGETCFCHHNSHINNFVCVLILRNLDVLGLVVDLLLVDLLDDPGRLHFDSVDDVFVHGVRQLSVDLRFREPLRYHVSFLVSVCTWLLCHSELVY